MTRLLTRPQAISGKIAKFAAYAVLISGLAAGCNEESEDSTPKSHPQGIPRVIPTTPKKSNPKKQPPKKEKQTAEKNKPETGPGCPEGMARIEGFCIDRYEIHLVDKKGGEAHQYFERPPYNMLNLVAESSPDVFPQGYMSQQMGEKACSQAGKRLCTFDEWQRACKGKAGKKFPYGNASVAGKCNVDKRDPHILDKHFPNIPHMKRAGKEFNDPSLLQDPDYIAKTGQFASCVTPEGVYDLDGNLSEWVSDKKEKGGLKFGTFVGDSFSGYGKQGCERSTDAHTSGYHDYSMGTRCCADLKRR